MFEHETLYSKEKVLGLDVADIKAKVSKTLVAETVMKSVPLKEEVTKLIPGLLNRFKAKSQIICFREHCFNPPRGQS